MTARFTKKPVPVQVPAEKIMLFRERYNAITKDTDRLFIFAADQKMEHLAPYDPQIFFEIAAAGNVGAFATHAGLISQYGAQYPQVNYIVKLNGKTNIIPAEKNDPLSTQLWSVSDVVTLAENSTLLIRGVGYTIYLGSEYESTMLTEAAQIITEAHEHGLLAIIWMYPRGKFVENEYDVKLISGAAGVAASLGADFVKIKAPRDQSGNQDPQLLQDVVTSAGTTGVLISGGPRVSFDSFCTLLKKQLALGAAGCAVGRNIFEHPRDEAIAHAQTISKIVYPV